METTLEQNLLFEVLKKLNERRDQQKEYIISNLLERDEYALRVGQIRTIDLIEEDFKQIHNAFFPST